MQKYNRSAERPVTKLPTLPMTNQDPNAYMILNTVIPAKLKVQTQKYQSGGGNIDTPSFQSIGFDHRKAVVKRVKDYRDENNKTNAYNANTENSHLTTTIDHGGATPKLMQASESNANSN